MSWNDFIRSEKEKQYFKELVAFILQDSKKYKIFPPSKDVFNAFKLCPLDNVKVVILGMDPYHGENQAHGLAFSVNKSIDIPPSLKNIIKEIKSDLGLSDNDFKHGCLECWAKQGVMLLNSMLTVRDGEAGSHKGKWEIFTNNAIKLINDLNRPIVYILWGNFAKNKKELITNSKHLIVEGCHPSPLSCKNFFGGKYFSKANEFLIKNNIKPIDWRIE